MKQHGYFLIGIRKTITLYLWSENKEDLEPYLKPHRYIVPQYKDGDNCYIEAAGKMIKIK